MLKTALVAMTIVGCDCDAKLCEFVSETPARWASLEECEIAVRAHVIRAPGVDYPLVTGICRTVQDSDGNSRTEPTTALASLDESDGTTLFEMVRNKSNSVWRRTTEGYHLAKAGLAWTADRVTPSALAAWVPVSD